MWKTLGVRSSPARHRQQVKPSMAPHRPQEETEIDTLAQGHTACTEWSLTLHSGHLPPEAVLLADPGCTRFGSKLCIERLHHLRILGHVAAAGQPGGSCEDRNISQRRLQPTGKAVLEWRAQTSWRPGVRVCQVPLPRLGSSLWVGLFHPGLTLRVHGAQIQLKSQVPHQLACVLGQSTLLLGLLTESPERAPARSPEH